VSEYNLQENAGTASQAPSFTLFQFFIRSPSFAAANVSADATRRRKMHFSGRAAAISTTDYYVRKHANLFIAVMSVQLGRLLVAPAPDTRNERSEAARFVRSVGAA
jgi:hypothetical protein